MILNLHEEHGYPKDIAEETVDRILGRIEKRSKQDQSAIESILKKIDEQLKLPG